jgi:hypothetical protein
VCPALGQGRTTFHDAPIREVIGAIEASTPYRFLYRDALIAGKTVSVDAEQDALLEGLEASLARHGLRLEVDSSRSQVFILEGTSPPVKRAIVLMGQVMDDRTGARLPYATITWRRGGDLRGGAANEAGVFNLTVEPEAARRGSLELTISYVGYETTVLTVNPNTTRDLPIRLVPRTLSTAEVVVSSAWLQADLDTTWHHLVSPGLPKVLGEGSVLRSLMALPSVSMTPALGQGLNVRGSRSDGFQVLLDGVSIYNQHHFFGLFDAFNADALQTVGLYYGISPAHFQGPPGGTLAFATRTGSMSGWQQTFGVSNASIRGTVEGPVAGGKGSLLLSGRHSYLGAVDWFNNGSLVAQGLGGFRDASFPRSLPVRALISDAGTARFYDFHGKLYFEEEGGGRYVLNAYLGGDNTKQTSQRSDLARLARLSPLPEVNALTTRNTWRNEAFSLHRQQSISERVFTRSVLSFSRYGSRFDKDDFVYLRQRPDSLAPPEPNEEPRPDRAETSLFTHDNDLVELAFTQHVDVMPPFGGGFSAGIDLHRLDIYYSELSTFRTFEATRTSTQLDLYTQYDWEESEVVRLHLGVRSHYFGNGRFLRLSPRFQAQLFPVAIVTFGAGYSRNHQFLHRLTFERPQSADVWVMSGPGQEPGSVDHYTASLQATFGRVGVFRAEAYHKVFTNLRQHETAIAPRGVRDGSLLLTPWLHDTNGRARGLELMTLHRLGPLRWTNSYTLSRMEIQHDDVNGGQPFPAEWDRRHQFTANLEAPLSDHWSTSLTWFFATGAPNTLAYAYPGEPERLPSYHRLDANLRYRRPVGEMMLDLTAALFNAYGRNNTWYRSPVPVVTNLNGDRQIGFVNADVYDLGFQPSFSLSLSF